MHAAASRLANAIRALAGMLMVVVAFAMLTIILGRYVGFSTAWADEVARIAFIWSVGLGAASGTYRGLNFAIPLIGPKESGRARRLLDSAIALTVVVLCALMVWATSQSLPVAGLSRLPALGISAAWFHVAITTFAVLTAGFMFVKCVSLWRKPE